MGDIVMTIIKTISLFVNFSVLMICLPRRWSRLVTILLWVAMGGAVFIFEQFSGGLSQLQLINAILFFPLSFIIFKAHILQILFAIVMPVFFTIAEQLFAEIVLRFFLPYGTNLYWTLYLILSLALIAAFLVLVVLYGKQLLGKMFAQGRTWEWALYAFSAILSLIIMMMLRNALMETHTGTFLLALFFTVWTYVILCFAVINTHEKTKQKYEADFARDIISSGQEHYQKMNEQYDALRIMKHDYKFHLNTALGMLQRGEIEKSGEYLTGLQAELSEHELSYYCSNPVINSLVADYAERCKKLGIKNTIKVPIPDDLTVPNYDMCIILGNLLENAMEACQKLKADREIQLVVKPQGEQLAIMVRNNFDGEVITDSEQIISTKKDGGLGLRSVQAVASKHSGALITEHDGEWFKVFVLLRIDMS